MAQVMVNFRMDEEVKKAMEQACKEMGLSMTTAFTIFATKVGREKRIPFEITADPFHGDVHGQSHHASAAPHIQPEDDPAAAISQKREQLELLCAEIRLSLTRIHTAIPASACGLAMERIRLLCSDELKDKAAAAASAFRSVLSERHMEVTKEKDFELLNTYVESFSSITDEIISIEHTLVPALRSLSAGTAVMLVSYEKRLAAVSHGFDQLHTVLQSFIHSTARKQGTARAVQTRIQQASALVSSPEVKTALESLDILIRRYYDALDPHTKAHLESFYLQTLELTLRELEQAERTGEDVSPKAALCCRTIHVISQVLSAGRQTQQELSHRNLEAEVVALERLAAMRGDIPDGITPP